MCRRTLSFHGRCRTAETRGESQLGSQEGPGRSTDCSHRLRVRLRVRLKILCCDGAVVDVDENDRMTDQDESIAEHYNYLSGGATAMGCLG